MSLLNLKNLPAYALIAIFGFLAGTVVADWLRPPVEKKIEIVEVEKVVERVRTITKIKESPDGTKETVIVEDSLTESDKKRHTKEESNPQDQWTVGSMWSVSGQDTRYGLFAHKRLILNFNGGAYIQVRDNFTAPVYGLMLSTSF